MNDKTLIIARTLVMSLARPCSIIKKRVYRVANKSRRDAIHLFLLSPPLSGSTVIKQLISTSPCVTNFKTEGQWLPEAKNILGVPNRWDSNLQIDWEKVKGIFYSYWSPLKPIRFEKSPPHLIGASQIQDAFHNCYFIISIRNPYAQIEGLLRREWASSPYSAAKFWIRTAEAQIYNLKNLKNTLFFTYEQLTENTELVTQKLLDFLPELRVIYPMSMFSAHNVTGKPIEGLLNLNKIKIQNLNRQTIVEINEVLVPNKDILSHFGYDILEL